MIELVLTALGIGLPIIGAGLVYIVRHAKKHQQIDDKLCDVAPNSELQYIKETVTKVESNVAMILNHLLDK